jgi:hypothetical protein
MAAGRYIGMIESIIVYWSGRARLANRAGGSRIDRMTRRMGSRMVVARPA